MYENEISLTITAAIMSLVFLILFGRVYINTLMFRYCESSHDRFMTALILIILIAGLSTPYWLFMGGIYESYR